MKHLPFTLSARMYHAKKNIYCSNAKRLFASTTSLYMIELPAPLYMLFIVYFRQDLCFYEPGTIWFGIPSVKSDILVTTVYMMFNTRKNYAVFVQKNK